MNRTSTGRSSILVAFIVAAALFAGGPVWAGGEDEAEGVQSRRGNPSPTAAESDIDDYTFQDEQINIDGNRDAVVKVLRVNQKNLVNDYVVGIYPIRNAHPKEIRSLFRLITAKEGGRAEVIRDKIGGEAFLQVIAPKFQLPYIEEALQALDEDWVKEDVDGATQVYYRAKFRDVAAIDDIAEVPGGGDGETTVVDATANAIFKRGEPYRMKKWLSTAEEIDLFPPQVLLDASVYELEITDDLKLGLDYVAWKCGPGRNLFDFTCWGLHSSQDAEDVTSIFDPFVPERLLTGGDQRISTRGRGCYAAANYVLASEFIDFLLRRGKARLVTTGRLNVRHGTTGTLSVSDDVIHFQVSPDEQDLLTADLEDYQLLLAERCLTHETGDLTLGLGLSVIPFIGLETTELVYALTMNDLVGTTPSGAPLVRDNNMVGSVLIRDGVPTCLGGLKRTEDIRSTAKVPLLGSIPVLGYLFGGERNAQRHTEMVVVLTPKVVQYSEIHKELARAEDKLVRRQVMEKAALPLPKTQYGFDQWLIGDN